MNKTEYYKAALSLSKRQPDTDTPPGQKFHIGDIVRIVNPINWYARQYDPSQLFKIEYSYYQKYGGTLSIGVKEYSLKHLFENNSSAWYIEDELELVPQS